MRQTQHLPCELCHIGASLLFTISSRSEIPCWLYPWNCIFWVVRCDCPWALIFHQLGMSSMYKGQKVLTSLDIRCHTPEQPHCRGWLLVISIEWKGPRKKHPGLDLTQGSGLELAPIPKYRMPQIPEFSELKMSPIAEHKILPIREPAPDLNHKNPLITGHLWKPCPNKSYIGSLLTEVSVLPGLAAVQSQRNT